MPELPEVETIVRGLRKKILNLKIKDVWSDSKKLIKKPEDFEKFKKEIRGKKIEGVERRGKNILINLSDNKVILIHQKITGHLLYGEWEQRDNEWVALNSKALAKDKWNKYLHLIILFESGKQLALSDLRKFAKVELWEKDKLKESESFQSLGPEPLKEEFTFEKFKEALNTRRSGKIKEILMDQKVLVGIGNIYASEILWRSKVDPFKDLNDLSEDELKKIYNNMRKILKKAIRFKGTSTSDFRTSEGVKGSFQDFLKVYSKEGEKCPNCDGEIKRKKISGRSTFYCPRCQSK